MNITPLPQELRVKILLYTNPQEAAVTGTSLGLTIQTLIEEIQLYDTFDMREVVQALKERKLVHNGLIGTSSMKLYRIARDIPYLELGYHNGEYMLSVTGANPVEIAESIDALWIDDHGEYAEFHHRSSSLVRNMAIIHKTGRSPLLSLTDTSSYDRFEPFRIPSPGRVDTSLEELLDLIAPNIDPIEVLSTLLTTLQWRKARLDSLKNTLAYKLYMLTQRSLVLKDIYHHTMIEVKSGLVPSVTQLLGNHIVSTTTRWPIEVITTDIPDLVSEVTEIHKLSLSIARVFLEDTESNMTEIVFRRGKV